MAGLKYGMIILAKYILITCLLNLVRIFLALSILLNIGKSIDRCGS
jgi:hypothetical protein